MKNTIVRLLSAPEADVLVFLHGYRNPTAEEWSLAMGLMTRYAQTADFRRLRCLAVSDGGGPDSTQRGDIQAFFKEKNHSMKTAAITTSVITRGIVAAVSWFNPHIKAFSPRHFADALAHLDISRATHPRILREYAEMEKELGPNSCLALINGMSASASATL